MKKYFLVWNDGFVIKVIKVFEYCEDGYCVCWKIFINKSDNFFWKIIVNVFLFDF